MARHRFRLVYLERGGESPRVREENLLASTIEEARTEARIILTMAAKFNSQTTRSNPEEARIVDIKSQEQFTC